MTPLQLALQKQGKVTNPSSPSFLQNAVQQTLSQMQQPTDISPDAVGNALAQQPRTDTRPAEDVTGNHDFAGLCQAYVEQQVYGKQGIYPTASAAFQDYKSKGQSFNNASQLQPGDLVYFSPDASNQDAGHTGIYTGNGEMQSATNNGIRTDPIADWTKSTGQSIAGYVHPFTQ